MRLEAKGYSGFAQLPPTSVACVVVFVLPLLLLAATVGVATLAAVFAGAAGVEVGKAAGDGVCAGAGADGGGFCAGTEDAGITFAAGRLGVFAATEAKDGTGNKATLTGEMSRGGSVAWRVPETSSQAKAMCNSTAMAMTPMRFCTGMEKGRLRATMPESLPGVRGSEVKSNFLCLPAVRTPHARP